MSEEKETMEAYEKELEQSLVKVKEGDMAIRISIISDTEVTVDLGIYSEGLIPPFRAEPQPQVFNQERYCGRRYCERRRYL